MRQRFPALRRVLGTGLAWAAFWVAATILIEVAIAVADPDSIDPGEAQTGLVIFGSMGFLSGVAFALLLYLAERGSSHLDLALPRTVIWGILGTAVVQLGFLNHGDLGLAANIKMALVFSVFGGLIAAIWLFLARHWSRQRSFRVSRP